MAEAAGGGFRVTPLRHCPHVDASARALAQPVPAAQLAPSACATCADGSEVWACLLCAHAGCSRWAAGHAQAHAGASGHALALSLSDMSVWCYACDGYVDVVVLPALHAVFAAYYRRAFGEEPALPVLALAAPAAPGGGGAGADAAER